MATPSTKKRKKVTVPAQQSGGTDAADTEVSAVSADEVVMDMPTAQPARTAKAKSMDGIADGAPQEIVLEARKKVVRKAKAQEKESHRVITDLYADHDASDTSMTSKKTNRRRSRMIVMFTALLLLCAAVAVAGFFVFSGNKAFSEDVSVRVELPSGITSGKNFETKVYIKNNETLGLRKASVSFALPEGYVFESSNPESEFANREIEVGSIAAGEEKLVTIRGALIGNLDSTVRVEATVQYTPGNFNSEFQRQTVAVTTITESTLQLKLEGPVKAVQDQAVTYTITYTNTSDVQQENLRVVATVPENVQVTKTSRKASISGQEYSWAVAKLGVDEEGKIVIEAVAKGQPDTSVDVLATMGVVGDANAYQVQAQQKISTQMLAPQLTLSMKIGGAEDSLVAVWGNQLTGSVVVKNTGDSTLSDVVVELDVDESLLDMATLSSSQGVSKTAGKVSWSYTENPNLAKIEAGKQVELAFSVDLRDQPVRSKGTLKNPQWNAQARVTQALLPDVEKTKINAATKTVAVRIGTVPALAVESRYYDAAGAQVGSGPLPPVVGRETTYRVGWSLKNISSDISGTKVSTQLPEGALWANETFVSAGTPIVYEPATRTVTWDVGTLAAYAGYDTPSPTAWFKVTIEPGAADVDTSLPVSGESTLSGKDAYVGRDLGMTQPAVTTNANGDSKAAGKGKVVAQ